jgi:hypothetical protein
MKRVFASSLGFSILLLALACTTAEGPKPHRALKGLWRDYSKLAPKRALAIAGRPDRQWVAGAAGGHSSDEAAQTAALAECAKHRKERRMQSPCRLYAVGRRIVW